MLANYMSAVIAGKKGLLCGSLFLLFSSAYPALSEEMSGRYERAIEYLPWRIQEYVREMSVEPHWNSDGSTFWYKGYDGNKEVIYRVDPAAATRRILDAAPDPAAAPDYPDDLTASPTGRWGVRALDGDLYAVSLPDGESRRLTFDAEPDYVYGTSPQSDLKTLRRRRAGAPLRVNGAWSPDGERFLTYRVDERGLYKLPYLISIRPGNQHQIPIVETQNTAFPGSEKVPGAELMIFDMRSGHRIDLDVPPLMMAYSPLPQDGLNWSSDGKRVYVSHDSRDYRTVTVYEADASTGKARVVATDQGKLPLRGADRRFHLVDGGKEIILYSERDDWAHYYLYDTRTGQLKNRITEGEWSAHYVQHVDSTGRWLYFTAGGREPGRDPYYSHLYRVRFDGSGLTLLTPEDAQHEVRFSLDGKFFIDSYSTVSMPPVTVLRASDGRFVSELARADISALTALGWTAPRRVKVKAADGRTDLYGTLYLPANLDERGSYPILDAQYSGPQVVWAPRGFLEDRQSDIAMAQLGFAVLAIDGRGTPLRSQSFQDVEFGEGFGSPAIVADHIAAMRQVADQLPFIDVRRAGIYGHSWGGYRAARAMLQFPDFFKAGLASAGSHDNYLYVFEHDRWFGMAKDLPETYAVQSNIPLAPHLKGHLLLVHGDLDDDVHVANTLQLADALIRANKNFEMLIFPDRGHHNLEDDGYFQRRKWDFFVEHLLNEDPPPPAQIPSAPP